jgi:hypothetical protein
MAPLQRSTQRVKHTYPLVQSQERHMQLTLLGCVSDSCSTLKNL